MVNVVTMTRAELEALKREVGEYSCSLPTGTTIGKRWVRDSGAYFYGYIDPERRWMIGEYIPDPRGDPKMVGIRWSRVHLTDIGTDPVEWARAFS